MKLMPGELYVSPLDLNIEHSKVVYPYEPTIRLATPTGTLLEKKWAY